MIKLSIIVPVYNTSKYLKKCLDSLIYQTMNEIEIIVINDGSTDNSLNIIKSYTDKRIILIDKENQGIGKTRNLGIEKARGEYISFIDSDDYVKKNFAQKMYEKAVKDNCDIVICDYIEDRNGEYKKISFQDFGDTNLLETPKLLNNINLGPCNKIYKKDLFINVENRFVENLKYEDAPFVIKMLLSAKKIGKINEGLAYYLIHNNSQTTVRNKTIIDILSISKIIIGDVKSHGNLDKELTDLIVVIITDYTIQQRYIKDRNFRNKFIREAFSILNELDCNWKNTSYLKKFGFFIRLIKSNEFFTKLYCDLYTLLRRS